MPFGVTNSKLLFDIHFDRDILFNLFFLSPAEQVLVLPVTTDVVTV
jgi:hypothetical protein